MIIIIMMMSMTILRRIQGERGKGGYAPGESSWIFVPWRLWCVQVWHCYWCSAASWVSRSSRWWKPPRVSWDRCSQQVHKGFIYSSVRMEAWPFFALYLFVDDIPTIWAWPWRKGVDWHELDNSPQTLKVQSPRVILHSTEYCRADIHFSFLTFPNHIWRCLNDQSPLSTLSKEVFLLETYRSELS